MEKLFNKLHNINFVAQKKIDAWDRKLIYYLEVNGRSPISEIAKAIGVSKQTAHYRLQNLVKSGIITSFITQLNVAKLGLTNYEVWMQLHNIDETQRNKLIRYFVDHPNTRWVASCGGRWDLVVAVLARNPTHFLELFYKQMLAKQGACIRKTDISIAANLYNFRRAHLVGERRNLKEHSFFGGEPYIEKLTGLDEKILRAISADARMPIQTIAEKIGATPPTVRTRLKRLIKTGVISGFKAVVHPDAIGMQNYEILLTLQNVTTKRLGELFAYCRSNPNVTFYIECVGEWNVDIAVDAKDSLEFQKFVSDMREKFGDIIKDFDTVQIIYDYKYNYWAR